MCSWRYLLTARSLRLVKEVCPLGHLENMGSERAGRRGPLPQLERSMHKSMPEAIFRAALKLLLLEFSAI